MQAHGIVAARRGQRSRHVASSRQAARPHNEILYRDGNHGDPSEQTSFHKTSVPGTFSPASKRTPMIMFYFAPLQIPADATPADRAAACFFSASAARMKNHLRIDESLGVISSIIGRARTGNMADRNRGSPTPRKTPAGEIDGGRSCLVSNSTQTQRHENGLRALTNA